MQLIVYLPTYVYGSKAMWIFCRSEASTDLQVVLVFRQAHKAQLLPITILNSVIALRPSITEAILYLVY